MRLNRGLFAIGEIFHRAWGPLGKNNDLGCDMRVLQVFQYLHSLNYHLRQRRRAELTYVQSSLKVPTL